MIIECPRCESKVDAKEINHLSNVGSEEEEPAIYYFLQCPICKAPMLAKADVFQTGPQDWDYDKATRLWPRSGTEVPLHYLIPDLVRKALVEAQKCYGAKAYGACAVMCGRAIEAICAEHKTVSNNLARGLKELKEKGVIDGRLFEWGDALRERRNIGAHATEEDISKEDAKDVLDFAIAICEYVFVLSDRYADFKARSKKKKPGKIPPPRVVLLHRLRHRPQVAAQRPAKLIVAVEADFVVLDHAAKHVFAGFGDAALIAPFARLFLGIPRFLHGGGPFCSVSRAFVLRMAHF